MSNWNPAIWDWIYTPTIIVIYYSRTNKETAGTGSWSSNLWIEKTMLAPTSSSCCRRIVCVNVRPEELCLRGYCVQIGRLEIVVV
jgi:hypothetical protein